MILQIFFPYHIYVDTIQKDYSIRTHGNTWQGFYNFSGMKSMKNESKLKDP